MRYRAAWLALLVLAAGLHLWRLDERTFHHDESIHAALSWDLASRGDYRYDPTYHGPLLYHLTAATFDLLGDSDFTARLPVAVAGILMVLVAWDARRWLGEGGAWWTGLLFTISPIFLYYGRFLRMDVLEAALASAALVAFGHAVEGSSRAFLWFGVLAGLALATKENVYVSGVLVVVALSAVALRFGPRKSLGSGAAWLWEHRWGLLAAAAAAVVVAVPLYTVFFKWPGDWSFPLKAVRYWWQQHSIERVGGPWWYHLPRLLQYELLPLAAAVFYMTRRGRRTVLEVFLFTFGIASIAMYAYLGEKTPWLEVHQVWAFIPLAGLQLARSFSSSGRWPGRVALALGLAATLVVSVTAAFITDEISPSLPRVESFIYVQTCPEVKGVVDEALALKGSGEDPVAAVAGESGWPLTWYWRHLPVWWEAPKPGMRPPIVLCDPDQEPEIRRRLGPAYSAERIPLRAWWSPEEKRPTAGQLLRYLLTRKPWIPVAAAEVAVLRRQSGTVPSLREAPVPAALAEALGVISAQVEGEGFLAEPHGLAEGDGYLAVADTGSSQVLFFDARGVLAELAVPEGLKEPEDVAWLAGGVLAVADTWNHRVLLFAPSGGKVRELPPPGGGWYGPRSVAEAPDGTLAVADTGNKRIVLYAPGAKKVWEIGGAGSAPGRFNEPVGLAWAGPGRLLVCDTGNRRIQVLDPSGRVLSVVPLPQAWPDIYSRPQIAVVRPGIWIASDQPARRLWLVKDGRARSVDLSAEGIAPTGVAMAGDQLLVGDASGRVWRFGLPQSLGSRRPSTAGRTAGR
ncbi:MAG: TIGR03663 family protein [Acidobacteria bacterium]|nr:TIGR03663 family protein [Acidobacteriota bacterium]